MKKTNKSKNKLLRKTVRNRGGASEEMLPTREQLLDSALDEIINAYDKSSVKSTSRKPKIKKIIESNKELSQRVDEFILGSMSSGTPGQSARSLETIDEANWDILEEILSNKNIDRKKELKKHINPVFEINLESYLELFDKTVVVKKFKVLGHMEEFNNLTLLLSKLGNPRPDSIANPNYLTQAAAMIKKTVDVFPSNLRYILMTVATSLETLNARYQTANDEELKELTADINLKLVEALAQYGAMVDTQEQCAHAATLNSLGELQHKNSQFLKEKKSRDRGTGIRRGTDDALEINGCLATRAIFLKPATAKAVSDCGLMPQSIGERQGLPPNKRIALAVDYSSYYDTPFDVIRHGGIVKEGKLQQLGSHEELSAAAPGPWVWSTYLPGELPEATSGHAEPDGEFGGELQIVSLGDLARELDEKNYKVLAAACTLTGFAKYSCLGRLISKRLNMFNGQNLGDVAQLNTHISLRTPNGLQQLSACKHFDLLYDSHIKAKYEPNENTLEQNKALKREIISIAYDALMTECSMIREEHVEGGGGGGGGGVMIHISVVDYFRSKIQDPTFSDSLDNFDFDAYSSMGATSDMSATSGTGEASDMRAASATGEASDMRAASATGGASGNLETKSINSSYTSIEKSEFYVLYNHLLLIFDLIQYLIKILHINRDINSNHPNILQDKISKTYNMDKNNLSPTKKLGGASSSGASSSGASSPDAFSHGLSLDSIGFVAANTTYVRGCLLKYTSDIAGSIIRVINHTQPQRNITENELRDVIASPSLIFSLKVPPAYHAAFQAQLTKFAKDWDKIPNPVRIIEKLQKKFGGQQLCINPDNAYRVCNQFDRVRAFALKRLRGGHSELCDKAFRYLTHLIDIYRYEALNDYLNITMERCYLALGIIDIDKPLCSFFYQDYIKRYSRSYTQKDQERILEGSSEKDFENVDCDEETAKFICLCVLCTYKSKEGLRMLFSNIFLKLLINMNIYDHYAFVNLGTQLDSLYNCPTKDIDEMFRNFKFISVKPVQPLQASGNIKITHSMPAELSPNELAKLIKGSKKNK